MVPAVADPPNVRRLGNVWSEILQGREMPMARVASKATKSHSRRYLWKPAAALFDDPAVHDHADDAVLQKGDVLQWITIDDDDVRQLASRYRPDFVIDALHLRSA